jgi:hypothetical protein
MPEAGFELKITESERAKTVHSLGCSATVTDFSSLTNAIFLPETQTQFLKHHEIKFVTLNILKFLVM